MSVQEPPPTPASRRSARVPALRTPFPGYDVLQKWRSPSWNDQTRRVVAKRLEQVPERRFFTEAEWALAEAICARLVPQPDREPPIPIVPFIDDKLARNQGDGYRFEGVPPEREAWRRGLAAIDAEARARHGAAFAELDPDDQDEVLSRIQAGEVETDWGGLPPKRFFGHLLLNSAVSVYYAHPDAWSEIGFGGPASPRGYVRLDKRDPWEAKAARD
jgi:hypothetical protein